MCDLYVNVSAEAGRIKPMHCVNNGPAVKWTEDQRVSNLADYTELEIPYARNHDASFCSTYGGEHTVDVNFIFPDFDADPYDEASYDFACTDEYIRVTELAGTKTFYRLGTKIEHAIKKYNTLPPKDFKKWAVICEHIIRHYNEGWAKGFHYNLEYWEIWNEPNLVPEGAVNQPTWGGTVKQFYDFYCVAAKHLKEKFPELKIGGPAYAGYLGEWLDGFLQHLTAGEKPVPLDFFSWHLYEADPKEIGKGFYYIREKLDKYGYTDTEQIVNEWNYVKGWTDDEFVYSLRTIPSLKGAAFVAALMCLGQKSPVDMLMYYDARPSAYNGLWAPYTFDRCKPYYAFAAFGKLYRLGQYVPVEWVHEDLYVCAAKNESQAAIMLVNYSDDDNKGNIEVALHVDGIPEGAQVECYLLDEVSDLQVAESREWTGEQDIVLKHNTVMLLQWACR